MLSPTFMIALKVKLHTALACSKWIWSRDWLICSVCFLGCLKCTFFLFVSVFLCVSVCLSVSHSSIWILLIPFSSFNPSFFLSPSHTLFAPPPPHTHTSLSPPLCLYLSACLIAAVCIARSCIFHVVVIHLAATRDKHVVVDRRLGPGPEEQADVGGPCPGPNVSMDSHLARWSGVELSPLFIKCTHSLCLASPWPPAWCHSGTREN